MTPSKRVTAGLRLCRMPEFEEEACGRELCGVERPAHNEGSIFSSRRRQPTVLSVM